MHGRGGRDDTATESPDPLLSALGYDPVDLDQLQARTGWPTAQLSARLLELELMRAPWRVCPAAAISVQPCQGLTPTARV